jgi:hypothetical protein
MTAKVKATSDPSPCPLPVGEGSSLGVRDENRISVWSPPTANGAPHPLLVAARPLCTLRVSEVIVPRLSLRASSVSVVIVYPSFSVISVSPIVSASFRDLSVPVVIVRDHSIARTIREWN